LTSPSPAGQGRCQEPLLRVRQLSYRWADGREAVRDCDLSIPGPGLWMLVGSNGSGKSTLLRLITGLLQPSSGCIESGAKPALVFQNPDHQLLLPSCGSDLQLGLPRTLSPLERRERVQRALTQVGLADLRRRPIHTLSGGQKQRLAIAGALASEAGLLLLDEPTALLDPESQREVLELIRRLCHRAERPLTALWITHRLEELDHCDGAARMEAGRVGPWRSGVELRQRLTPLPAGRAEG
jgi:energy-coupling factor transport system ATP-binding protein